jgi:hypothetical protein
MKFKKKTLIMGIKIKERKAMMLMEQYKSKLVKGPCVYSHFKEDPNEKT